MGKWRYVLVAVATLVLGWVPLGAQAAPAAAAVDVSAAGITVVSGFHHSCVLKSDKTVACWGHNQRGQVGSNSDNATIPDADRFSASPVAVPGLIDVASVTSGDTHTCALKIDGTVWCWGEGADGELGKDPLTLGGSDEARYRPAAQQVSGLPAIVAISAGSFHTCALSAANEVWCWGLNSSFQLGTADHTLHRDNVPLPDPPGGTTTNYYVYTPTKVAGLSNVIALDAGYDSTCAVLADGTARCWGGNASYQLGNGSQANSAAPVAVAGLERATSISVGFAHACARQTSGTVRCWGSNDHGQLGNGGVPDASITGVTGLTDATSVVAGYYTTCAVRTGGAAVCWGWNGDGQLGDGTTTDHSLPTAVSGLTDALAVAPGYGHSCAVRKDLSVACWGDNSFGALGDGHRPTNRLTPEVVNGVTAIDVAPPTATPPAVQPAPVVTDQPYRSLVKPERVLDTRPGAQTIDGPVLAGGLVGPGVVPVKVAGHGSTPSSAASVFVNVTVVGPRAQGYVTVYPCGQAVPSSSNLNFVLDQTVANAVMARVGDGGQVCLYASVPTHLIVDVAGYFPDGNSFSPLVKPVRVLDTRAGGSTDDGRDQGVGRRSAGTVHELTVSGRSPLPGGVASVALNVTVDNASQPGYLTVYPCDQTMPEASVLNYQAGQTIAGLVVAKASAAGTVCIYTSAATDLIADASGYFATTVSYAPLAKPLRFMETRAGAPDTPDHVAHGGGPLPGGTTYELLVGNRNGISATAGAVLLTIAVPSPRQDGFVTVYPCGTSRPEASNLNYQAGKTIANTVAAGIGAGRKVCIYVYGTTDVIVDVAGTLA